MMGNYHARCGVGEKPEVVTPEAYLSLFGQIPNLEKLVATIRSREISACLVLQAQSQLKAIYKDNADTIIGNMDSRIFLGSSESTTLKELNQALGAGLGIWGAINLLEGYGNDNPGAKSQGMKQLMAGGVALIGTTLVPLLSGLFG